jgi:A/G-specific adenine glycosylase
LNSNPNTDTQKLAAALLNWFTANARDLPWRRTRDPYAIWVSEIMLQQTQVKTVIPFWNRWMKELPTIEAAAKAPSAKIHKLWEGLGYYTRVRNLQKAAQQIVNSGKQQAESGNSICRFPENFDDVLALPGIGRYTAGAICSIAFNQPVPILDGNVIRVLTRLFGIAENPKDKKTNQRLWQLAEELVNEAHSVRWGERSREPVLTNDRHFVSAREDARPTNCSHLNQSLMELGALICTPRSPQCLVCPVKKFCVAFKANRTTELPNLGKREAATARHFIAFAIQWNGKFLVQQRPSGVVNAQLWEFPNLEITGTKPDTRKLFVSIFGITPPRILPLCTVKHSITRYRITLEAFHASLGGASSMSPFSITKTRTRGTRTTKTGGVWKTPAQLPQLAFTAAHKKLASAAVKSILSGR